MKDLSYEAKLAVFHERLRIIDEIDSFITDGDRSDDLMNFETILTENMISLGEELGVVKHVRTINAESLAADRQKLYKRLKVVIGKG